MKYLAFAALVCACAAPAVQDDGPGDPPPLGPVHAHTVPPGEQEQGRHLLGNFADAWTPGGEFLAAVAPAGLSLNVSNGRIELRNSAGQLVSPLNRPLPTRRGGTLIIDGVDVTGAYHLRYIDPAGGGHDYCDPTENAYAVAMPGYWTAGRSHTGAGGTATFACQISGKAAACMAWGYNPDAGPGSSGWQLHQACIQMKRAAYFGDGVPYTINGTLIYRRDNLMDPQMNDPLASIVNKTEALWDAKGAVCVNDKYRRHPELLLGNINTNANSNSRKLPCCSRYNPPYSMVMPGGSLMSLASLALICLMAVPKSTPSSRAVTATDCRNPSRPISAWPESYSTSAT